MITVLVRKLFTENRYRTETVIYQLSCPRFGRRRPPGPGLTQAWPMSHRTAAAEVLARQDGLITRRQARDLGLSDQVIRGLRHRGEWQPVLPGVFRVVEGRPSAEQRIRAASLWAGEPSCVSGIAAAAW